MREEMRPVIQTIHLYLDPERANYLSSWPIPFFSFLKAKLMELARKGMPKPPPKPMIPVVPVTLAPTVVEVPEGVIPDDERLRQHREWLRAINEFSVAVHRYNDYLTGEEQRLQRMQQRVESASASTKSRLNRGRFNRSGGKM